MAISVERVIVKRCSVNRVVVGRVVVDNYKSIQIPPDQLAFLVAENILNKIVNIRLPAHLGA